MSARGYTCNARSPHDTLEVEVVEYLAELVQDLFRDCARRVAHVPHERSSFAVMGTCNYTQSHRNCNSGITARARRTAIFNDDGLRLL
jgi:hypothetical protein